MELDDRIGVLFRHDLDLDATFARQHHEVFLLAAVEGEGDVVLLVDIRRSLNPETTHNVSLYVHAQNVAGVFSHFGFIVGQLDATGLAAAPDLHLRLDDHGVTGRRSFLHRLIDGVGWAARADRNVVASEILLALIFKEIHGGVPSLSCVRMGCEC